VSFLGVAYCCYGYLFAANLFAGIYLATGMCRANAAHAIGYTSNVVITSLS